MNELLLKLYEKHPFMKDNGARSCVTDKLVAEEFYKMGYNAAINEFAETCFEEIYKHGYPLNSLDITVIADQMKAE